MKDFADKVRATYWYVPAIMTLAAAISSLVLFSLDQTLPTGTPQSSWLVLHLDTLSEAHQALVTIAETALSVTGVVFSIILVPLSISATQYGSIVLRGFLRDRSTQFVLGAYTSSTFYCLILNFALRTTSSYAGTQLSVTVAFYLLLVSLLLLIYFFHHVADSLQAAAVIDYLSKELGDVIRQTEILTPTDAKRTGAEATRLSVIHDGEVIVSSREGYVRAVDFDRLVGFAAKHNTTLYLESRPGDFISLGTPLVRALPPVGENFAPTINAAYMLGRNRTVFQDPEFGIYLIVTIAVRALSPAINDPYTPTLCLNRAGAALVKLAERELRQPFHYDKNEQLRVICDSVNFEQLTDTAFNLIREYGRANAEVLRTMLQTIKMVGIHVHSETQRKALVKHAQLIENDSHIGLPSEYDRQRVHEQYEETLKLLSP